VLDPLDLTGRSNLGTRYSHSYYGKDIMVLLLLTIVFLLGCCTGLFGLLFWRRSHDADRVIDAMDRLAEGQRVHVNAITAVMLNSEQQGVREILKELRQAAKDRRELMDYVMEDWATPESGEQPVSGDGGPSGTSSTIPGASTLPPDAVTPQSGLPAGELLRKAWKARE